MDRKLKDYIINNRTSPEMIFRNYKEFLDILFNCGGAVSEILWFEYVLQEKQKDSLGGGGWIDKENPEYMWAETMIFDKGLENRSHAELIEYIEKVKNEHLPHDLVPCFWEILVDNTRYYKV